MVQNPDEIIRVFCCNTKNDNYNVCMINGIIIMPINGQPYMRGEIFKGLSKIVDIVYVGLDDVKNVQGDISLKANIIVSNLKNYMALSKKYIFFDCENQTPQQRKGIIQYASKANYVVVGLVLDYENASYTILKDITWDEGFQNIIYTSKE